MKFKSNFKDNEIINYDVYFNEILIKFVKKVIYFFVIYVLDFIFVVFVCLFIYGRFILMGIFDILDIFKFRFLRSMFYRVYFVF